MIIVEIIDEKLKRTYSDEGLKLLRLDNGAIYEEAIDPIEIEREYVETDIKIVVEDDELVA